MNQWIDQKYKSGLTGLLVVWGSASALSICLILYFIWFQGMVLILGIPAQLLLSTIILPIMLAGLLFQFARNMEQLHRLDDDE